MRTKNIRLNSKRTYTKKMFKIEYCYSLFECQKEISRILHANQTCSHLKFLNGYFPQLNGIFLQNCSTLRKLTMVDCKIEQIHVSTFEFLVHLKRLNLKGNSLRRFEDKLFAKNSQLEHLNVSKNKLAILTDEFFRYLKNLKELILAENYLIVFAFVNLPNLLKLNLSFNALSVFENNSLPKLDTLNLTHNKLVAIKDNNENVLMLKTLLLDSNQFTSLNSHWFRNLPSLEKLTISLNQITKIEPDVFDHLRNLKTFKCDLNMSKTPFEIENELFRFNCKLTIVSLSNSRIKKIGENLFANLNNLKSLQLNRNLLTELPQSFLPIKSFNLDSLDLSENPIDSSGDGRGPFRLLKFNEIASLSTIKLLDLSTTSIAYFDEFSFFRLRIEQLSLRGNYTRTANGSYRSLIIDFTTITDLKILDLSDNNFESYRTQKRVFSNRLNDAALANNSSHFRPNPFFNQSLFRPDIDNSLVELYLNNCRIQTIPNKFFANLKSLLVLSLKRNRLVFLDHCLYPLVNLTVLMLNHNQLIDFNVNPFKFNTKLMSLNVTDNNLERFPLSFIPGVRDFKFDSETVKLISIS